MNIILTALVLATGLASVAVIAAQPLPRYKHGRRGGRAEAAIVGEAGVEGIEARSGEMFLTPNRASLALLPEGASVIPHGELLDIAGRSTMTPVQHWSGTDGIAMMELKNEMMLNRQGIMILNNTVKNKKEAHSNIDKHGIRTALHDGAVEIEWINNKIRM